MSADKKVHDADAFRKQLALAERVLCRLNENGSHMGRQIGIVNDNFEGKVGNYSAGEVILFRTGGGDSYLVERPREEEGLFPTICAIVGVPRKFISPLYTPE